MDLSIRRMRKEDLGWLYRLLSDPEVMRWLEPPYSMEQTEAFLFRAGLSENPLIYAAEEQGVPIGYVIDHPYDEQSREIGWILLPAYWAVSYTHLTLPTKRIVEISGGGVSFKKKKECVTYEHL